MDRNVGLTEAAFVVALVALFGAVLFPALGHFKAVGHRTYASNEKQLASAVTKYAAERSGCVP